jgi:precorrin-3B synthase
MPPIWQALEQANRAGRRLRSARASPRRSERGLWTQPVELGRALLSAARGGRMSRPRRETMRRGWCPGTLRPMLTGDGWLVRLHPPAALTPTQLAASPNLARRHGNGQIEISARGNLQLARRPRGQTHPAAGRGSARRRPRRRRRGRRAAPAGAASPLAGRAADELLDAAALAEAVERAGRNVSGLLAKFSIVVDGGGALALDGFAVDLRLRAVSTDAIAFGLPGSLWFGPVMPDEAPQLVARLLAGFTAESRRSPGQIRRMRDLGRNQLSALATSIGLAPMPVPTARPKAAAIGFATEKDSTITVLAGLPFGRTDAASLRRLGELARDAGIHEIRVSPWRGFAFCGLPVHAASIFQEALRDEGLIVEANDPRLAVSACAGAPACSRGEATTLADAAVLALAIAPLLADGLGLHVSGCAKSCAHSGSADLTLVGRRGRYDVIIAGGTGDAAIAHLSLTELVRRLEPGQDIRARLEAAQH